MCRYLLILCFIFAASASHAQFRDTSQNAKVIVDTGHFHMQKSPMLALALSAVLPGAGQIYTGGWYKAPFIVGGIVSCFIFANIQNGRYHVDIDSVNNQLARGGPIDRFNAKRYGSQLEFYRDDRDKWYIYAGLFYIANLLDAYISAHLFDFDVSDPNNTAYIAPPQTSKDPWRLAIRIGF